MHLSRLILRNFKKYRRAEIDFQDGLTGIVGSNGSGKSTIVEAIAWALYGNRASTIKRDLIRNTRAGDSDLVEVKLTLEMGKRELSIYRAMKGKGLMPEASLSIDGRRVASGTKEVDLELEELLHVGYQDFMKTFYARQKDLDNLLREGGTSKREYLLKLLGLDDVKERALDQAKADRSLLEERKNIITGALAEIGDVEGKVEGVARDTAIATSQLSKSSEKEKKLSSIMADKKKDLDIQVERCRSFDLLGERVLGLSTSMAEKKKTINIEESRLKNIQASKEILAELEPKLKRLKDIRAEIELVEPRKRQHEELIRMAIGLKAQVGGAEKLLSEMELRLSSLVKDRSTLEDLRTTEDEYDRNQKVFSDMEALREEYFDLQAKVKGERIRLDSIEENINRTEASLKELRKASIRFKDLQPSKEEQRKLRDVLEELTHRKERKRELDALLSRKTSMEARRQKLSDQISSARKEISALGDLEARGAELKKQDSDLDKLCTALSNTLADLKSNQEVLKSIRIKALKNQAEVRALGADGVCPTCERPLGDQYKQLLAKYLIEATEAENSVAELKQKMQYQKDLIDGAAKSRSNLKIAFDDLNSNRSKRAALHENLKGLEALQSEILHELKEMDGSIKSLGDIAFDTFELAEVQSRLEKLVPIIDELNSLSGKISDLPKKEDELRFLSREKQAIAKKIDDLGEKREALGYSESNYAYSKKKLSELKASHEKFNSLSQKIQDIPDWEEKILAQRSELDGLRLSLQKISCEVKTLDFDQVGYESLTQEKKTLLNAEEEARRIALKTAVESDIRSRLESAIVEYSRYDAELKDARGKLEELGYSEEVHQSAKKALVEAEITLEDARKEVSERNVHLALMERELSRLKAEAVRKKNLEREFSVLGRRLEVVDTARSLVNRFMDQVLLRVKDDIARTAGEILEEVSGKYSLLKIDDDFNIMVEDGGEYYPISRYSGGEVDMIAVSVRVAISEYLMHFARDGPGYSFLILDEIFGSQDMEHREKMIGMLRSLEVRFPQVIVISHISDVQGQFDNTIAVVEDDMGNSRAEVS